MARRHRDVTINTGTESTNRDLGKTFRITELSAADAEQWATDALQGLAKSGVELPDDAEHASLLTIATLGFKALAGIEPATMHDLMERMFACIQIKEKAFIRNVTEDDIEEVGTRLKLRMECFELHTGFSFSDARSKLAASAQAKQAGSLAQ